MCYNPFIFYSDFQISIKPTVCLGIALGGLHTVIAVVTSGSYGQIKSGDSPIPQGRLQAACRPLMPSPRAHVGDAMTCLPPHALTQPTPLIPLPRIRVARTRLRHAHRLAAPCPGGYV